MDKKKLYLIGQYLTFGFIIFLFIYFRLRPILLESVGYTYDQGRDFLKAAEIVMDKNPVFIGPTTGINGIFHGAWWFYLMALAFLLTGGIPIGFYYLNFFIHFFSFIIFILFAKRYYGFLTSAILATIVATSGIFITTSIFIANNVMAIPSVLMVCITTLLVLKGTYNIRIPKTKLSIPILLLLGMSLGFVAEFEFAYGLMLIPVYIVLSIIFNYQKKIFNTYSDLMYFFSGLTIPFIPRLLFELKNNFPQVKVLLNFIIEPKYFTPKPYYQIFQDRVNIFKGYFDSLFMTDTIKIFIVVSIVVFILLRVIRKEISIKREFMFLISLVASLFFVSTLYKDTFWGYYYDGIQYIFIFILGFFFSFYSSKTNYFDYAKISILVVFFIFSVTHIMQDLKKPIVYDGIQVQEDIVGYIQSEVGGNSEYCVKIYTPPVIPYTYNYLFLYNNVSKDIPKPAEDWVDNQCWFILEYDDYVERKQTWIKNNIPEQSKKRKHKQIKDVTVELWTTKEYDK